MAIGAFVVYEIQSQGLKQLNNFVGSSGIPPIHIGFINVDLSAVNFLDYQFLLYGLALVGDDASETGGALPEPPPERGAP